MIQMPELKLQKIIDVLIDKLRDDYNSATGDKSQSVLYRIFGTLEYGNYNLLENAVRLFVTDRDDPNTLKTRMMYDRERASLPTIHVTVPNEQSGVSDGIGLDAGYNSNAGIGETPTTMSETYNRTFGSKFNLIITGRNSYEVIVIFYVLKILLYNNIDSLEYNGFRNAKIYGGDLKINDQIMPVAYMRILILDSFYELEIPKFGQINIVNNINFEGEVYDG